MMELDTTHAAAEEGVARSASVAGKLAQHLQGAIVRGDFPVGSSLPSERELMVRFEVSRTTVREALRILGVQGLVEVRRGRRGGSYVSNHVSKSLVRSLNLFIQGQDIRFIDLVQARQAIEPAAAAQAANSRSEEQLEELRQRCVECERLFEQDAFVEANLEWHSAVARASNNPLFVTFLTSIAGAMHAGTDLEVFDAKQRKAVVGVHWQIYEAIRVKDPQAARRRMERHLSAYGETLLSAGLPDAVPSARPA